MLYVYHERVPTALVLSAGGLFAAWEIGVLKAFQGMLAPDLIVGASAGAWIGWALAGGASIQELEQEWRNPRTADLLRFKPHRWSLMQEDQLHDKAQELFARFRPRIPFALTVVEVPRFRLRLVRGEEICWRHLAAACSIPVCFPPVVIRGARYVDGGLRGALPLWAAREMGATRAVALNCLTNRSLRVFRALMPSLRVSGLTVQRIEPRAPLGSLRDAVVWSPEKIDRWMKQGVSDGNWARNSITM
jgi:NTE family protein